MIEIDAASAYMQEFGNTISEFKYDINSNRSWTGISRL